MIEDMQQSMSSGLGDGERESRRWTELLGGKSGIGWRNTEKKKGKRITMNLYCGYILSTISWHASHRCASLAITAVRGIPSQMLYAMPGVLFSALSMPGAVASSHVSFILS
jgi:hypothetical protein